MSMGREGTSISSPSSARKEEDCERAAEEGSKAALLVSPPPWPLPLLPLPMLPVLIKLWRKDTSCQSKLSLSRVEKLLA